MKRLFFAVLAASFVLACNTQQRSVSGDAAVAKNDTVRIANDSLEYEIIIVDAGFNNWMATRARPRGFYTQPYLEQRNRIWVSEWNNRARMGGRNSQTFMPIDYFSSINYGYEVNYLLFNYLTYFQITKNIKLGGFTPRI